MNMGETEYMSSFDETVARLERNTLPSMQNWSQELAHEFENVQVKINTSRSDNHPRSIDKHFYSIYITCSKKDAAKFPDHGDLMLSVALKQHDEISIPIISAEVGMLVDEESEGDWGFHRLASLFSSNQQVQEDVFEVLENSLPQLYRSLRSALKKPGNAE